MKKEEPDKRAHRLFKEVLGRKLNTVNAQPANEVWQRLESSLDRQANRPKPAAWRKRAGLLAACLLVLGTAFVFYLQRAATPANTVAEAKNNQPENTATTETEKIARNPETQPANTAPLQPEALAATTASAENKAGQAPETAAGKTLEKPEKHVPEIAAQPKRKAGLPSQTRQKPLFPPESSASTSQLAAGENKTEKAGKPKTGKPQPTVQNGRITAPNAAPEKAAALAETEIEHTNGAGNLAEDQKRKPVAIVSGSAEAPSAENPGQTTHAEAGLTAANQPKTTVSDSAAVSDTAAALVADSATAALPATGSAQIPEAEAGAARSISVGLFAGPSFFRQNIALPANWGAGVTPAAIHNQYMAASAEFNANTKPGASVKAGILLSKPLGKNVHLQTGLGFSGLAAQTQTKYLAGELSSFGSAVPNLRNHQPLITAVLANHRLDTLNTTQIWETEAYQINFRYQYLHLPVRLQVQFGRHKWHCFAAAGFEISRLLKSQITATHPLMQRGNLAPESSNYFRKWQGSGLVAAGFGYQVWERVQLQASGELNVAVKPVVAGSHIRDTRQGTPKIFSLALGLTYRFGPE